MGQTRKREERTLNDKTPLSKEQQAARLKSIMDGLEAQLMQVDPDVVQEYATEGMMELLGKIMPEPADPLTVYETVKVDNNMLIVTLWLEAPHTTAAGTTVAVRPIESRQSGRINEGTPIGDVYQQVRDDARRDIEDLIETMREEV